MKRFLFLIVAISFAAVASRVSAETYETFPLLCDSAGFKADEKDSFYFVHVTDIHITGSPSDNRAGNFRAFTEEVRSLNPKPAFVMITGDLVESGQKAQYEVFKTLIDELEKYVPVYISLGNHDVGWNNPATGAEKFQEIFEGRQVYGSFDKAGIRFAWVFPYPSLRMRTVFGYWTDAGSLIPLDLGQEQEKWLTEDIASAGTGTLVLFFHQPPGDVFGDEMLFGLMKALSKSLPEREVWLINGHGHADVKWRQDLIPEGYVRCVMTSSLAYERSYRIFFAKAGRISLIALKKLGGNFIPEPKLSGWQARQSLFGLSRPPLLMINVPFDDTYVLDTGESVRTTSFRSIKNSSITYKVPLINGAGYFGFCVTGQYLVEISDGETWVKIAGPARKPEYQSKRIVRIPEDASSGETLYIRFSDPTEGDRFGMTVAWFGLFGTK